MARVNAEEVRAIIDVDATIADLSPFIKIASLIVDERLSASGLPSELLKEIERWLSAHFVAIRDPRAKSESIGGISVTYGGETGQGLHSTLYGQQAMALDVTGSLSRLGRRGAIIHMIGSDA